MTSKEYRKRIEAYIIIENNLIDIETYVKDTLNYFENYNKNYDIKEIIMYLSSVGEKIEEIRYIIETYFELKNS